jgi:hypothetical protein
MFISKKEKTQIEEALKAICMRLEYLSNDFLYLSGKVKALEGGKTPSKKPRKQSTMSAEGRARIGAAVKAYHAKKKLEKKNANSVSTTGQ